MALLPFPVASVRVYGCLLSPFSLLDYGVPCALLPPCQPLLGGCSGAKGKGEEGGCPIPTKMIFFFYFFLYLNFFFFPFLAI